MFVNRVALFVTAHAHIVGAIISQRDECFSEQVRLLFVVNLRRFKVLVSEQFRITWLAYQGKDRTGLYCSNEKCAKQQPFDEVVDNWIRQEERYNPDLAILHTFFVSHYKNSL